MGESIETPFQVWEVKEPYLDSHCQLGEGPFYEAGTNTLRFVDIKAHRVHSVSLAEGPSSLSTIELDVPVTVTADVDGIDPADKILIGAKYGIALLDRKTGTYEYVARFGDSDNKRLRSNDGAADPNGRFWLGNMTDFGLGDFQPEGGLFRFDGNADRGSVFEPHLTIPNSIGWSPDNRTMYFTHSTPQTVFAYDFDPAAGALSNRRVWYQHDGTGDPDGFRVDVDGNVWHAVYGESRVLKLSPEGKLIGEVRLPTRNITCPQFVGTELFITSAADDEGEGGETSKKFGGGVFRVDVGVKGLDQFAFKLA